MYPEEALEPCVQSATIMWEHVERFFANVRQLMRKSGDARSGSFSIPWTAACMSFFQVKWNRDFVVVACCKLILLCLLPCKKALTKPDKKHCSVLGRKQSRLDATLGYRNLAHDMERCALKFATR